MGTILALAVVALLAGLCIRNLVLERRRGECCECSGDCNTCKIQCRSNEKYYGAQRRDIKRGE